MSRLGRERGQQPPRCLQLTSLGSSRLAGGGGILASSLIVSLEPSEALGLLLRLLNHPLALCHMGLSGGLGLGGRCSETVPQLLDSFVAVGQLGGLLFLLLLDQLKPLLRPISFGAQPISLSAQGIFYLLRGGG
jgi:hypothetical protein